MKPIWPRVLVEVVASREIRGGENRVRFAHVPQVKTLEDFDFSFQRSVKREEVMYLAQLDFLREKKNLMFLGSPGTGKTRLSISLAVQAARRGDTGRTSPQPKSGSQDWPKPRSKTAWTRNSSGWCVR